MARSPALLRFRRGLTNIRPKGSLCRSPAKRKTPPFRRVGTPCPTCFWAKSAFSDALERQVQIFFVTLCGQLAPQLRQCHFRRYLQLCLEYEERRAALGHVRQMRLERRHV